MRVQNTQTPNTTHSHTQHATHTHTQLPHLCHAANAYPDVKDGYVPVECKKGSMVVIHGHVIHLSLANTSQHSRHAYTFRT